jgi:hypothetical protein
MGMVTAPAPISGLASGWPPGTRGSWPPWGAKGSTWGRGDLNLRGGEGSDGMGAVRVRG